MIIGLALLAVSSIVINTGFSGSELQDTDINLAVNAIAVSEVFMCGGLAFLTFGIVGATMLVFGGGHLTRPTKLLYGISSVIGVSWIGLILFGHNVQQG